MTVRTLISGLVVLLLAMSFTSAGRADDKEKKSADSDPANVEALMKAFAKPGKSHKHFKRLAGTWKAETKSYYKNPEKPSTSEGEAKFAVMMGGRYLRQNFRGEFDGQRFIGMGITGYDNALKKYVGMWIDNNGTGIMRTEGSYDVKTNTMTEIASASSPLGEMKMRMVTKYVDDNKFLFTMYAQEGENEKKIMEMTYTRTAASDAAKEQ